MGSIRGIAELVLNVRDIAAMERFYTGVLGLAVHSRHPETDPTIVFIATADLEPPFGLGHPQVLALIDPARHPPAIGRFDAPERRRSTLNHFAFEIDAADYDAEVDRLNGLGIETELVKFPHMRAKAIFFRDPEDNTVELICHDRPMGG